LEQLSNDLQDNKVSIDELVPRMKDALAAIKVCKSVLRETKSQLTEVAKEFEDIESEESIG
jgi:chromosome segregation ATPase